MEEDIRKQVGTLVRECAADTSKLALGIVESRIMVMLDAKINALNSLMLKEDNNAWHLAKIIVQGLKAGIIGEFAQGIREIEEYKDGK